MEEVSQTVSIPGRVGGRLRAILALQASLHRMPPRRPASIIGRPEFGEALAYLRLAAETRREDRTSLEWWDAFLLETPSATPSEPPTDEAPRKNEERGGVNVAAPARLPPDQRKDLHIAFVSFVLQNVSQVRFN